MSTTLQSSIEEFSAEDQKLIQSKASVLAEEMVRHADSLAEVRSALVKTQDEVQTAHGARSAPPRRWQ